MTRGSADIVSPFASKFRLSSPSYVSARESWAEDLPNHHVSHKDLTSYHSRQILIARSHFRMAQDRRALYSLRVES